MNLTDEIFAWAQKLKPFQQCLLRRLSETSALTQKDLDDGCRLLLDLHNALDDGEIAPVPLSLSATDLPQSALSTGSVRITSLSNLEDVNAIVRGQTLEFGANGLTVIYGDNGSGKSSYARILKGACRASDRSNDVIPNVFRGPSALEQRIPKATLNIEVGGNIEILVRSASEPPIPQLTSVSVLDTACARMYADKGNEIAYIPTALTLFNGLAEAQDRISLAIDSRIAKVEIDMPKFSEVQGDTMAGQFVANVVGTTKVDEIERRLHVTDDQRNRLAQLEEMLSSAAKEDYPRRAADERRKAISLRTLKTRLAQRFAGLALEKVIALRRLRDDALAAEQAAQLLLNSSGLGEGAPGIGGALWKTMWTAVKSYCEHEIHPGNDFPLPKEELSYCPLCHQELDEAAQSRFETFREVASGAAEQLAMAARQAFDKAVSEFRELPAVDFGEGSTERLPFTGDAPLEQFVLTFLDESTALQIQIEAALADTGPWEPLIPVQHPPLDALDALAGSLERRAAELETLANEAERIKAETEARELRAWRALSLRREAVLKLKADRAKIAALKKAQRELNTRSITMKQSELMDKVVTESLRTRLSNELRAFNLTHIPIKINSRGSKGVTTVDVKLDIESNYKVSSILSEGELRALALAFFLAEIGEADHDGSIILDDPVSSLDHQRRDYVADRLVEEARRRQVIVFTHDLVFLSALQLRAEKAGVVIHSRQLARIGQEVGYAWTELPWVGANCKRRLGILRDRLVRVRKSFGSQEYPYDAKQWLGLLREAWERAVEEKLLGDVVQRYRPSVETQRIKYAKLDVDLIQAVELGMTECSNWVHDQAAAINHSPPSIKDLEEMLTRYETFIGKFK